ACCGRRPRRLRVLRRHDPRIHEYGPRATQRARPHTPPYRKLAGRTLALGIGEAREDEHSVDALSDILAAIRLDRSAYVKSEFKAPWCVQTQDGLPTAASRLPRSDHIVFFHLLTEGARAWRGSRTGARRWRSRRAIFCSSRMTTGIFSGLILRFR